MIAISVGKIIFEEMALLVVVKPTQTGDIVYP